MGRPDLWEIYRQWHAGHSVSAIARSAGWDRKTVRQYVRRFASLKLQQGGTQMKRERFLEIVEGTVRVRAQRAAVAREQLGPYEAELRELISRDKDPLKPKTAFLVVKTKYELDVSYETFKRFARRRTLARKSRRPMIRIELPPGQETQLDYGQVGSLVDPVSGKDRTVYAFCGLLSYSRLPYLEFVRRQDEYCYARSVVSMLHEFEGATEWISIDNLKAGVVKPDLWDPTINHSLAEVTSYYGVFVNPCRVRRSTDKGKVERIVPVAREVFRMLKELHPSAGLVELNEHARRWVREVYGRKEHGTTGIPPLEAFEEERRALKPLPAERFEVALWKQVTVHPGDQFISFQRRRFSLPPVWKGLTLWARYVDPLLGLYDEQQRLIRQYVVRPDVYRYWVPEDFPEGVREMMDGGYPAWLIEKSAAYGEAATGLIRSVLRPHAYLNARRARGMLDIMAAHHGKPYFQDVCGRATRRSVSLPSTLRRMMEAAEKLPLWQQPIPISRSGSAMVREIQYYVGTEEC